MKQIQFASLGLPVSSIAVKSQCQELTMECNEDKQWMLSDENSKNVRDAYQLLVNQSIRIPDLSNRYIVRDNEIFSIPIVNERNLNSIHIADLFCCEHIGYSPESDKFMPLNRTDILNNKNELINIWCEFENVKFDFVMFLEIFSSDTIFDIIPVEIHSCSKESNYATSFYCTFRNDRFRESKNWNIRVRITENNTKEIVLRFNYLKAQAYHPSLIKGGPYGQR